MLLTVQKIVERIITTALSFCCIFLLSISSISNKTIFSHGDENNNNPQMSKEKRGTSKFDIIKNQFKSIKYQKKKSI